MVSLFETLKGKYVLLWQISYIHPFGHAIDSGWVTCLLVQRLPPLQLCHQLAQTCPRLLNTYLRLDTLLSGGKKRQTWYFRPENHLLCEEKYRHTPQMWSLINQRLNSPSMYFLQQLSLLSWSLSQLKWGERWGISCSGHQPITGHIFPPAYRST